jgi:hypothetical protein
LYRPSLVFDEGMREEEERKLHRCDLRPHKFSHFLFVCNSKISSAIAKKLDLAIYFAKV